MNLESPICVPPDPLAGPRSIGDSTDFIKLDPANGKVEFAGAARPTVDVSFHRYSSAGAPAGTSFADSEADNFLAARKLVAGSDQGVILLPARISEMVDVSADADIIVCWQQDGSGSGNVALQANWDVARPGNSTVIEGNTGVATFAVGSNNELFEAIVGVLVGGTAAVGDWMNLMIRRMGTDAGDTFAGNIRLMDAAVIRFKRKQV